MNLNDRPSSERIHIGFFGQRNAGKSSVVNAMTGQRLSLVSDVKGTTTDPVQKAMELLPLGPVLIIDTPGTDDEGTLGELRVQRAKQILDKTDIAVLVVDAVVGIQPHDLELCSIFRSRDVPYIIVMNKADLLDPDTIPETEKEIIFVSAVNGTNIDKLKAFIGKLYGKENIGRKLTGDIIEEGDIALLVTPIDDSAPKGRLILPQQQTIRDILDNNAINIVVKDDQLQQVLDALPYKPKLVITDSQVFAKVNMIVTEDIMLTSFSILFARYKGELSTYARGAAALDSLKDGDIILISEACTHHRQCNDIGTIKLPDWIMSYTGKNIRFEFTSGGDFPEDLSKYALVIHCGACMLNEREMKSRMRRARMSDVPITNYGTAIAHINGILKRSLSPFPELEDIL